MIFNHRAVSLAVFGSLALSSASSNALASSADQHNEQQNRARRAKKSKSTLAADDVGVDQMTAGNRVDGGEESTSKKSSKADAPVATPVTPATTSGPTAMIQNKIYDEEELVLPLNVANDTVVSKDDDSDELKPIFTETFYMHLVPEGEDNGGGTETKAGGDDNVEGVNVANNTVVSKGDDSDELKPIFTETFYMHHVPEGEENSGGTETKAGGDDIIEGDGIDDEGGVSTGNVKPIGDNTNFYEDYVPDEGVGADGEENISSESDVIDYGASPRTIDIDPGTIETPTVTPTTSSPTHKPTNAPIVPPPPLPTNAPIVAPPTDEPEYQSCFEENDVFVCIYYYEDLSCDMIVDGTFCNCCHYHPTEKFVSTFDCTNVGDEWGQMGLCEPGPMPIAEEKEDTILEEDGLSILSLDYGEDDNDLAADAISIAWSTADGDVETDSKFTSLAVRQRRGRRRAQAVRRRAAATKKRREAMVK